jgi:predicted TIM-barrel fold metal-dependent hydrolase
MTTIKEPQAAEDAAEPSSMVIDTDVHETFPIDRLLPHLEPVWRRYITDWRFVGPPRPVPYSYTSPHRADRFPAGGGRWGSDLGLMRKQLFEDQDTTIAILNNPDYYFSTMESRYEFAKALASAYNDCLIVDWLENEPRLRGSIQVVAYDPPAAAREIDRVGHHPQMVQVILPTVNNRQYGDRFYWPIFEACVRNGLVLALHLGATTETIVGYPNYYVEWHTLAHPQAMMGQLVSLIFNGAFDKFPDLKVICLEAGFTWLPHLMLRMDRQHIQHREEVPWLTRKPSEHLRDSVRVTTQPMDGMSRKQLMQIIEMIGTDTNILFSSDYPHYDEDQSDTALPHGLSPTLRRRILYDNALNTYPKLSVLGPR